MVGGLTHHQHDVIHLWTIQREEAWRLAQEKGVLQADGRRVFHDYRYAYQWLQSRMAFRMSGYSGRYPIWAWARPKPDLRSSGHFAPGSRGVRISFVVPISRVLLLDFHAWHAVLNDWYLALTEKEDDVCNAPRLASAPALNRHLLEESWNRVFDLALLDQSPMFGPVQLVQAVTEEVHLNEVISVDRFTAR